MAVRQLIVDDLNGAEDASTIVFALDGQTYEVDLAEENEARLRELLGEFITVARMIGRDGKAKARPRTTTRKQEAFTKAADDAPVIPDPMPAFDSKIARAWLRENGHEVQGRGRIRDEVVLPYLESPEFKTWQETQPE